ncbi:MAG: YbjN domain-containing protein [Lachnospiraceae bacterium]|nr:YbjN domain-containing protein [Lachnospiraceae bacterium]
MKDVKKELLEVLESQLKEDDDFGEMSIFTAKELNAPMDILRAEIAEFGPDLVSVLGEFFFMPIKDEENMLFTIVISLSNTVPPEAAPDVAAASARINYLLPCGSFAIGDEDRNLVYKYTAILSAKDNKDEQIKEISRAVNAALAVSESFFGYMLPVLKNDISVEEMVDMLHGGNA